MSKAPVVTELPLQNVRFLFGTMVDLRMLPQVLEQTGNAEVGEFKLVAHFPEADKASGNEAAYLARHKGFGGGDYNTYHGDPYKLDEIIWDASGRAGIHLVTKTKYGQVVEFPTIPDKNDSAELMLIVSEYVESIKTPPLIVRCSGMGGSISPLGNKKYQLNLSHGTTKCPTKIKDHVPKKYHAEDSELIPHVGGPSIFSAEDLSPAERSLISNTISNQMQGYYRTGVIGTEPVIGAYPDGPMSIAKRTPEAKQEFFREPAVQDEDGYWNKGPNRWQANKIARGVAYGQLEKSREMGALNPGYKHRGSSGRFRRNPFIFNAEELGCCFCGSDQSMPSQYGTMCGNCAIVLDKIITTNFAPGKKNPAGFTPSYHAEDKIRTTPWNPGQGMEGATFDPLPFEDFAAERKLMCAEHDDYFNACGCGSKNAENRQPPWSATNPRPNRRIECGECDARGFIAGKECTKCDGAGYWNIHSPRCATCDTDIQWTDGAECDGCESWYCDNHLTEDGGCKVCGNTSLSFHSEDIPVWNDGVVEWETSGPMSPTGSAYSSASVPPTGVMPSPGDTFLNYTDAQNNLVESSGGLWGAEESSAKSVEDLIIQIDNGEDVFLHHLTKNQIDALSDHYSGSEIRSCFTCSVLTDDWDLISEGYECGTCSEGNRTDYEKRKYDGHLGPFGAEEEESTPFGSFVDQNGKVIMVISDQSHGMAIDWGLKHFGKQYPGVKFVKYDGMGAEGSLPQMDYSWINYGKGKVYGEKEAIKMLKQQIKKDFPKEKIQSISVEQFDSGEWRGEVKFGSEEEESMTDWDCQYCGHNRKTTHQHRNPNPTLADEVCSSCGVNADFEAEEESTPVMDPMEFGEPVNWIPLDGTPSLKRRKNAESDGRICCDDKMQSFGDEYHCVICGSTEGGFGQLRSESFEAMAVISPKNAKDVEKATAALKKRYKQLKIKRVEHIVNRKGSSNKYHIFIFTNKGIFNVYGRIGVTMNIFGPMSKAEGDRKFDKKLKQGYREL